MRLPWDSISVRLVAGLQGRGRWRSGAVSDPTWDGKIAEYDLWYVLGGSGWMITRNGKVPLRGGICLWMRPGWTYVAGQDPRKPLSMNWIHFELLCTDGRAYPSEAPLPPEVFEPVDPLFVEAVTGRVVELCHGIGAATFLEFSGRVELATALMRSLLMHLDAEGEMTASACGFATRSRHREVVLAAANTIRDNLASPPSFPQLAAKAGYTRDHFTRIFKAVTGRTPEEYLIDQRVSAARELLRRSTLSVKEIASKLGYGDIFYFSRQFKQRTGQCPTAARSGMRPL